MRWGRRCFASALAAGFAACGTMQVYDPAAGWIHAATPGVRAPIPLEFELEVPVGWTYRRARSKLEGDLTVLTREGLALDAIEVAYLEADDWHVGPNLGRRWPNLRVLSLRDLGDFALGVHRRFHWDGSFTVLERRAGTLFGQPACRLSVREHRRAHDEVDVLSVLYAQARGPGLLLCTFSAPELRVDASDLEDFERLVTGPIVAVGLP